LAGLNLTTRRAEKHKVDLSTSVVIIQQMEELSRGSSVIGNVLARLYDDSGGAAQPLPVPGRFSHP
jgi:hypothetical protein